MVAPLLRMVTVFTTDSSAIFLRCARYIETKDFTAKLNNYFETTVEIPRMKVGKRQTIETLINEEALLLAKYLRNEKKDWIPRTTVKQ